MAFLCFHQTENDKPQLSLRPARRTPFGASPLSLALVVDADYLDLLDPDDLTAECLDAIAQRGNSRRRQVAPCGLEV
jgi:hypothetical protein